MARFNPVTGQWEEKAGTPIPGVAGVPDFQTSAPVVIDMEPLPNVNPRTGMPLEGAAPDAVSPNDLVTGTISPELRQGAFFNPQNLSASPEKGSPGAPGQAGSVPAAPEVTTPAAPASAFPMLAPDAPKPIDPGLTVTTERTKQSKEALAGQGEQLAAAREGVNLAGREGKLGESVAQDKADLAAEEARQKEAMRVQEMADRQAARDKLQAAYAERDRILDDAQKQSTADYWSDKPAGAKVLANFSSALGTYVAIRSGSGKNFAQEELDRQLARDDARKQQILKNSIYRAGLKGQDAKEAYEFGIQEINLRKSALLDKLADERAAKLAARGVDASKIETDALINKAKGDAGKLRENFGHFADVKVATSNALQQQAKMAQAAGAPPATLSEREKSEAAAQSAATLDKARQFIEQHPQAWKEYQEGLKEQNKANMIQKTKMGAEVYNTAGTLGMINTQMEQRLKSPEAKEIHSMMTNVITAKARELDPVGVLNPSSADAGRDALGLMTRDPKAIVQEMTTFRDRKLNEAKAAAGSTGYIAPSLQGSTPPQITRAQLAQGVAMLSAAAKKGDKQAATKLAEIKQQYGL